MWGEKRVSSTLPQAQKTLYWGDRVSPVNDMRYAMDIRQPVVPAAAWKERSFGSHFSLQAQKAI